MDRNPAEVLFFSDIVEELVAAREAGLATVLVRRTDDDREANWQPVIRHFGEVRLI